MAKETKIKEEVKEKKCDCGPDCKCGCQEGKECTCCCHGGCSCKHFWGKVLFIALVFFAGMGVNQFMNDACFGRCPSRKVMRPMPMMPAPQMHGNLPVCVDAAGNKIFADKIGGAGVKHGYKGGHHKHGRSHVKIENRPHHGRPMPKQSEEAPQPENSQPTE